ncbi:hypothetical protein, partial [Streptococcus gordonii]|uniref:hypothetical protein n=1 Tax=Streptococcus gordonii TaxID=1302 RepID=UPI0023AEE4B2
SISHGNYFTKLNFFHAFFKTFNQYPAPKKYPPSFLGGGVNSLLTHKSLEADCIIFYDLF